MRSACAKRARRSRLRKCRHNVTLRSRRERRWVRLCVVTARNRHPNGAPHPYSTQPPGSLLTVNLTCTSLSSKALLDKINLKTQRRLSALSKGENELRQKTFIKIMVQCTFLRLMSTKLTEYRGGSGVRNAAKKIQQAVRGFVSRANFTYMVRAKALMHRMWWRIRLWLSCARRRIAARLVRSFFQDFSDGFLSYIIMTFRWKMLKLQNIQRSFLRCKQDRVASLVLLWDIEAKNWEGRALKAKKEREVEEHKFRAKKIAAAESAARRCVWVEGKPEVARGGGQGGGRGGSRAGRPGARAAL